MPSFNIPGLGLNATDQPSIVKSLGLGAAGAWTPGAATLQRSTVLGVVLQGSGGSSCDFVLQTADGSKSGLVMTSNGVVTLGYGLVVSAGGLIVAAGGASIAGVATLTGASGSLVARPGVNYTGGALDVGIVNVANLANVIISPNTNICTLSITCNSDGTSAIVGLRGGANVVDLFVSSGSWGTTAGGAHNFNVYYDGAGNYRFENRSGGICAVSFLRMGQVPNA